jgi:hypothetical protein
MIKEKPIMETNNAEIKLTFNLAIIDENTKNHILFCNFIQPIYNFIKDAIILR